MVVGAFDHKTANTSGNSPGLHFMLPIQGEMIIIWNKSQDFKVTHQAPFIVVACFVLAMRVFLFYGRTDGYHV